MNDTLLDLLLNGFMIYPCEGKFVMKKESVPSNLAIIKEKKYDSYEIAIEAANDMLKKPIMADWSVIVRYNRGLGIEYKNLPDVCASNKEQAQIIAENIANQFLDNSTLISEVKVFLKF